MQFQFITILTFLSLALASPAARHRRANPFAILLAGDSTTASGGGWGDGFKNYTLNTPSFAINYGHSGATTSSFIAGGDWGNVLASVAAYKANYQVLVTIQFGHNDQKIVDYNTTFIANLNRMVSDVRAAGGSPVLVTSLSRRNYLSDGVTINDILAPWAGYTLDVAESTGADSIDLWATSLAYLEKIGVTAARRLDLSSGDHTHLNIAASVVFGRMVSDLLVPEIEGLGSATMPNATLSQQIRDGVPSV